MILAQSLPTQAPGVDRMADADWLGIACVLRDRARAYPLVKSYWDKAGEALSRG